MKFMHIFVSFCCTTRQTALTASGNFAIADCKRATYNHPLTREFIRGRSSVDTGCTPDCPSSSSTSRTSSLPSMVRGEKTSSSNALKFIVINFNRLYVYAYAALSRCENIMTCPMKEIGSGSEHCPYDWLAVYDGKDEKASPIGKFCGMGKFPFSIIGRYLPGQYLLIED